MVSTVPEKDTELKENTDQLLSFNKKYLQTYTHICNTDFFSKIVHDFCWLWTERETLQSVWDKK